MGQLLVSKSRAIADMCCRELNISDKSKIAEAQYGAYHTLSALIKIPLIYIPAIVFGLVAEVIAASIVFSILRFFAGGVHAKTHKGCAFVGNFIMGYAPLIIARATTQYINTYQIYNSVYIVMAALSLMIVAKYAPSDLKGKPIYSIEWRTKLKVGSVVVIISIYIISLTILSNYYSMIVLSAMVLEAISITPLAYKVFNNKYGHGYGTTIK